MQYIFLGFLFFLNGNIEQSNFLLESLPILKALFFLNFMEIVFFLDIFFDLIGSGPGGLADDNITFHIKSVNIIDKI